MTLFLLLLPGLARAVDDPLALAADAVASSPSLVESGARADALQQRAEVARVWMDPVVSVELSNLVLPNLGLAGNMMGGVQLRVAQMIPAPGLPAARAAAAEAMAAEVRTAASEAGLALRIEVQRAYWQLALTRRLRDVLRENVDRTEELVAAVRARYEVGGAGQGELLRLQVLRDRLDDEVGDLDRSEAQLLAALAGALARPGLQVETPEVLEPRPVSGDLASLVSSAEGDRPLLEQLSQRQDAARAAAKLARAEARPSPTVWAGYRVRLAGDGFDGSDLVSVGVSAPVPVASGRRARGMADASLADASAAAAASDQARLQISSGVQAALAGWARADEKARRYGDDLRPQAEAALRTTLNDYQVGKTDFASLYQAQLSLLDLERAWLGAVVETHLQALQVERLTGGP